MQNKERAMFGKSKDDNDQLPSAVQQSQQPAATKSAEPVSADQVSTISRGMSAVGKIVSGGTVHVLGQVEGELRALTVLIAEGAKVEGDVVAEELTIGGMVKGTIHANRVKLNSTAVVEGDIFHRSLSIEENARFEGRQNVRTMLSMCRAPYCSPWQPTATSRQRLAPSRAIGNPMERQAMMDPLTWEHGRF
jgi:cytoskeletal protein CcmA (bactofilin family)